jgi:uncharacterized membrane protein YoaT (DUF817 family)
MSKILSFDEFNNLSLRGESRKGRNAVGYILIHQPSYLPENIKEFYQEWEYGNMDDAMDEIDENNLKDAYEEYKDLFALNKGE